MKTVCILLASGSGSRFGGDVPKQFAVVRGKMIVEHTLDVFVAAESVDEIVVVVSPSYRVEMEEVIARNAFGKPIRVVEGGATRKESMVNGVRSIRDEDAKLLIHNAVQPLISVETIEKCVSALEEFEAVSVGSPCVYTILELDERRMLRRIVPRSHSVNDLGPECFRLKFLRRVLEKAEGEDGFTNITGMVMRHGLGEVYVVEGDPSNIKVTYAEDLLAVERILAERARTGK